MPDQPLIRPATAGDVAAAREIARLAWQPVYAEFRRRVGDDIFQKLHADWEQNKMRQVSQAFDKHPGCMLVTEVDGTIAAFITFFVINGAAGLGEIGNNAVHPDFQGRGLGRAQYQRVFEELRAQGCQLVQVTTGLDDAHAPARRAYEAAGFDIELPKITYMRKL
ncbi:MAG: GNAT family N-acetyltransferase [Armatimonadota bacterium]